MEAKNLPNGRTLTTIMYRNMRLGQGQILGQGHVQGHGRGQDQCV